MPASGFSPIHRLFLGTAAGCALVLAGCLNPLPVDRNAGNALAPTVSGCNSCHLSPPPTGSHEYHLYKQQHRPSITCRECHASAIRSMIRTPAVKTERIKLVPSWSAVQVRGDSVLIVSPRVDTARYSFCMTGIRQDTLFAARMDSFAGVIALFDSTDSIITDPALDENYFQRFRLDRTEMSVDTIYNPFNPGEFHLDTNWTNIYQTPPVSYSRCHYQIRSDTLFSAAITPFDSVLRVLTPDDSVLVREQFNRLYVFSFQTGIRDTELYAGHGDTAFRMASDTLYRITTDSIPDYRNTRFAENTGLHGNGEVDLFFSHETLTLFREETLRVFYDTISGEIVNAQIRKAGGWNPSRLSCWSNGISNGQCHDRLPGREVFWYRPAQ